MHVWVCMHIWMCECIDQWDCQSVCVIVTMYMSVYACVSVHVHMNVSVCEVCKLYVDRWVKETSVCWCRAADTGPHRMPARLIEFVFSLQSLSHMWGLHFPLGKYGMASGVVKMYKLGWALYMNLAFWWTIMYLNILLLYQLLGFVLYHKEICLSLMPA